MISQFHIELQNDCDILAAKLETIHELNAYSKFILEKDELYIKFKLNPTYRFNVKEYHLHLNNPTYHDLIRRQVAQ